MDAPSTSVPELRPSSNTASPLQRTIVEAQRLRLQNPVRYGVKGARLGDANYVKNGWRLALSDAAASRRQAQGGQQKPGSLLSAEQQLILIEYHHKLHLLQAHYFPLLGRELSNKAKRVASCGPASVSPVTALPTTVVLTAPCVTNTSSLVTARICKTPPPMPLAENLLPPLPPPPPAPVVEESTTELAASELRRSKRVRNPSQAATVQEKSLGA